MEKYVLRDMMDNEPLAIVVCPDYITWNDLQRKILDILDGDMDGFDLVYDYVVYEIQRVPHIEVYDIESCHLGEEKYLHLPSLLF